MPEPEVEPAPTRIPAIARPQPHVALTADELALEIRFYVRDNGRAV
jgi:hypothetical protein